MFVKFRNKRCECETEYDKSNNAQLSLLRMRTNIRKDPNVNGNRCAWSVERKIATFKKICACSLDGNIAAVKRNVRVKVSPV